MQGFLRASKKQKAQSFLFVLPGVKLNDEEPTSSLLDMEKLPLSKSLHANESILANEKNQVIYQQPNQQEWSIQLSNHLRLINDKGSNSYKNKYTQNAIDIINKQHVSLFYNDELNNKKTWIDSIFPSLTIIEPTSNQLNTWNIIMAILLLVYFYFLIINLYFTQYDGDQEWYWEQWKNGGTGIMNYIYTLLMTIDIIIELHVSYFEKGEYVKDKLSVYLNYIKHGFIFDFIPLLVLYITTISEAANESTFFRYLFFFKFYRLTIYDERFQERCQLHRKSKALYLIFRIIVEIMILVQLNAAIFYRVGIYMYNQKDEQGDDYIWDSWLENDMFNGQIYDKPLKAQYYLSLYWSVATLTTVSYGDITPVNPIEIFISIFAMLAAIFLFALNVQTIQEVYLEYKASKKKFQKHLIAINRFMRDKEISVSLQSKIRKYLDHIWHKQRAREQKLESVVINSLDHQLRQELMFESYGMELVKIPWMSDHFSFEFIKELSEDIQEIYLSADEIIFKEKEFIKDDSSLYIIKDGEVELYFNRNSSLAHLKSGSVFGQYSFITGDERQCSAKTFSQVTLYQIKRSVFLEKLSQFEADYERYCQLKDQVLLGKRLELLNLSCFTCKMEDHMSNECPLSHYTSQSQKLVMGSIIIKKEAKLQQRKKYLRRNKKHKNLIVNAEEYDNEDNPFIDLEQYYQENQNDSFDLDKVNSFKYYYPLQNIDTMYYNQIRNISLNQKKYFTPPLRHQVMPT